MDIAVSIVLYKSERDAIQQLLSDIFGCNKKIFILLIDNSPTDDLKTCTNDPRVKYIFNNANLGYGAAHNIGLEESSKRGIKYHLVVNPDISFQSNVLSTLYDFMDNHEEVGLVMPKVCYEDGSLQRLCKLLPTPFDLIGRRFFPASLVKNSNMRYELHTFEYNTILDTACLSGCFMFLRTDVLKKSGLFDPRYFMYLEDYDLVRRIHRFSKTICYPFVSITHGHKKESYQNKTLLKIHLKSAISYFNKWGWFFDKERKIVNKQVLSNLNKSTVI
ncbi:glycosyltransferase family 2 protein [Deminuibacter soli]|uniref:Glycosyltransferase family 2 protein n=1 Tax=Deminuibacter soli TaxID=2291815 RepID=A0A3E1NFZ6_9BACT|nr:glycosyltransferase family 2 protein [Deminuibacter soli]